jgi:hypothetical protein
MGRRQQHLGQLSEQIAVDVLLGDDLGRDTGIPGALHRLTP